MLEAILEPVLEGVFELLAYGTGRLVVPLFTLGRVRVEPMSRKNDVKPGPAWRRRPRAEPAGGGVRQIGEGWGALCGLLFWFAVVVVVVLVHRSGVTPTAGRCA